MNKYYILNLDPQATHEWDRCVLRNPITGARPDFQEEVAQIIDGQPGSYLIRVNLQIEILERNATPTRKILERSGEKNPIAFAEKRLAS
jgi:hypothetical protein